METPRGPGPAARGMSGVRRAQRCQRGASKHPGTGVARAGVPTCHLAHPMGELWEPQGEGARRRTAVPSTGRRASLHAPRRTCAPTCWALTAVWCRSPGEGSAPTLLALGFPQHPAPAPTPSRTRRGHGGAAGEFPACPIHHRKARRLVSASRFPPAVPQDAMQSSLMHLDSFTGMRKCFQVSHKVPLRSQYDSIFSARIDNAFPSHPGTPARRPARLQAPVGHPGPSVPAPAVGSGATHGAVGLWGAKPQLCAPRGAGWRGMRSPILQPSLPAPAPGARGSGVLHSTHGCPQHPAAGMSAAAPSVAFAREYLHKETWYETKGKWPQEPRGAGPCSRAAHAHGRRIPGSSSAVPDAFPVALLISGSPAGLLVELAEATLRSCTCRVLQAIYSNDLTGSPAVPGPAPSLIGPARPGKEIKAVAEPKLLSLDTLAPPPGFDFKGCTWAARKSPLCTGGAPRSDGRSRGAAGCWVPRAQAPSPCCSR